MHNDEDIDYEKLFGEDEFNEITFPIRMIFWALYISAMNATEYLEFKEKRLRDSWYSSLIPNHALTEEDWDFYLEYLEEYGLKPDVLKTVSD